MSGKQWIRSRWFWKLRRTKRLEKEYQTYRRKHSPELDAVMANLNRFKKLVDCGIDPRTIQTGYIHLEKKGVIAIDQSGHGSNLAATRLYVYALYRTNEICLITIGDKHSQQDDIKLSTRFVQNLPHSLAEY